MQTIKIGKNLINLKMLKKKQEEEKFYFLMIS